MSHNQTLTGLTLIAGLLIAGPAAAQDMLVYDNAFFQAQRPVTALEMVQRLPGFVLDEGAEDQRGLAAAGGNVLINGARPVTKTDTLASVLRRLRPEVVERIELIRGGGGGVEMQGHSVVANIVLRAEAQTDRVAEVAGRLYNDGEVGTEINLQWTRRLGASETEASAYLNRQRGPESGKGERIVRPTGGPAQVSDLEQQNMIDTGTLRASIQRPITDGKFRLNGVLNAENRDGKTQTTGTTNGGLDQLTKTDETERELELGGRLDRRFGGAEVAVSALQTLNRQKETEDTRRGTGTELFGNKSTAGESILRAVARFKPASAWLVETGGETAYNFLDSRTSYRRNGVNIALPSAAVKVEEVRGEAFATATWTGSKLSADLGGRVEVSRISQSGDRDTAQSFFYIKPRALVTWSPAAGRQFRLRLEREVGQLDFADFVSSAQLDLGQINAGNPNLEPERSWTAELAYEQRFWTRGVFTLTALASRVDNVNDQLSIGGFNALGDIGVGDKQSLEAGLTVPLDRLGLAGGRIESAFAWTVSQVTDPTTGLERRFSAQAGRTCNVKFTRDAPDGGSSWGGEYRCAETQYEFRTDQLVMIHKKDQVNLFYEWKANPRMTIRADLYNALAGGELRRREIFAGLRNPGPAATVDDRNKTAYRTLLVQVRRVF